MDKLGYSCTRDYEIAKLAHELRWRAQWTNNSLPAMKSFIIYQMLSIKIIL